MEEPPVIQAAPETHPKSGLGRIGLIFSLAALGAVALMWLCKPG